MKKFHIYLSFLMMLLLMIFSFDSYGTRYSIDVKDFEFSPSNLLSVKIGDTIHWEWKNGSHTTTSTTIPVGATAWDKLMDASHLTYDYIPAVAGTYHYKCTPHESMGMVGQFTVLISIGIKENNPVPKITIYPNPFSKGIYINSAAQEGVFIQHFTIYDVYGKIIKEASFKEGSPLPGYLDLSGVPAGMIFVEFTDNLNRSCIMSAVRKE
jgi:plastocyanin